MGNGNLEEKEVKTWLANDTFIHVLIKGWFEKEETMGVVNKVREEIDSIMGKYPKKSFKIIVDLSELRGPPPPSAVRKAWVEGIKNSSIEKMGWWGASTVVKVLVSFILAASGLKNIKFFNTESQALQWLKEGE